MTVKSRIFTGIFWTSAQTIINRSFGLIIKLVLARILFPEDYGVVGMAVTFTSLFSVFSDMGFAAAIIQRKKERITQEYLSTAFWSGIIWSVFIFVIISFIIGPLAANFYDVYELRYIIPALGLSVLLSPLFLVQNANLTKSFNFKDIAIINNTANIISGIFSLIIAFSGGGVWALVINSVGVILISVPMYFWKTKWYPSLIWRKEDFHDLFGFGVYTTLANFLGRVVAQGDYLLIGKLIGKIDLGLYSFAFVLTDAVRSQLKIIIGKVLYPIYSELQDEKKAQFKIFQKNTFVNSLILTPLMFFLFWFADLVPIVFGEKWQGSVIFIQLISISVILDSLTVSFSQILRANNKTQLEFKILLLKVIIIFIPLVFLATYFYGAVGAATAIIIFRFLGSVIDLFTLHRILNFSPFLILKEYFKGVLPSICTLLLFISFRFVAPILTFWEVPAFILFIILFSYLFHKQFIMEFYKYLKK